MNLLKPVYMIILAGLLAACGSISTTAPQATSAPTATTSMEAAETADASDPTEEIAPTLTPHDFGLEGPLPAESNELINDVMADLAERLSIDGSEIEVVGFEEVMWSDASLGCPLPGMMYAQVVTEGYRIILGAGGESYEYHTDQRGFYVLCEDGEPAGEAPGKETPMTSKEVDQAKTDLADRLAIDQSEIAVVSAEEVTWRDGSLGCPQPSMAYTQALVNGSRIILEADGRQWHYHSGGGREPFLCLMPEDPLSSGDEPGTGFGDY